jgi:hypothetical protein
MEPVTDHSGPVSPGLIGAGRAAKERGATATANPNGRERQPKNAAVPNSFTVDVVWVSPVR